MNDQYDFERIVADTVRSIGPIAPADGTHDQILTRVRRTRQDPAWLALAKEPPMRSNSQAVVGSPTMRVAAIVVATLLLAATLAAAGAQRLLAADSHIVVAHDGSGDHSTISAAVAAAVDGDEIVVRPGTYAESVAIDKSITLRGDGDRDSVIVAFPTDGLRLELTTGSEGDPSDPLVTYSVPTGFQLAADAIELSGLTISGPRPGVAIAVNEGNTLLSDLAITLEGTDIDESDDPAVDTRLGVVVAEAAEAELRQSSLDAGIEAHTGSSATVEDSSLSDGGIWADPRSQLVARGNTMTDAGIASDGARAAIADNTLIRGFISVGGRRQLPCGEQPHRRPQLRHRPGYRHLDLGRWRSGGHREPGHQLRHRHQDDVLRRVGSHRLQRYRHDQDWHLGQRRRDDGVEQHHRGQRHHRPRGVQRRADTDGQLDHRWQDGPAPGHA